MKKYIICSLLCLSFKPIWAEVKETKTSLVSMVNHVEMHEKMAKAHQQTADCLKAGNLAEDCKKEFQMMCMSSGAPENCGPHGHKNKKMNKE